MSEQNRCDNITYLKYKKRLSSRESLEFPVATNSMEPLIKVGSIVSVSSFDWPLKTFDIIVYWTGDILMAHYIWNAGNLDDTILTRSLINPIENSEPIPNENILGIITNYKISNLERFRLYIKCFFARAM